MSDARPGDAPEVAQPSLESARSKARTTLGRHATGGSLTLNEYGEHARAIEQAATVDEIDAALRTLPRENAGSAPARRGRWLVSVFGASDQHGRWRLSGRLRIVALLGGVTVDLGMAQPEASESVITVVAILGGAGIIAPPGVTIQLSGVSLFGGKGDKRAAGPPLPGSPLTRVRAFPIFGGVTVKDRTFGRKLRDLIRKRRS
jgi:hypothetical protein